MSSIIHSIKYPFAIDSGLGKLCEENGYNDHVVQLMKQVLFTNPGERINRPDFGLQPGPCNFYLCPCPSHGWHQGTWSM